MNPCTCGHDRAYHREKMAREGVPRNVPSGCLYSPPDSRNSAVCPCEKFVEARAASSVTISEADKARKAEIEILERKARAMIALGEEILNRLREMKVA